MNKEFKKLSFTQKIKYICSIPVKDDGRALNIIFVLCLISIIGFSVFLYRSFTHFYDRLDYTLDRIQTVLNTLISSSNEISN